MLMPFGSAFTVNNLGIALTQLPVIYLVTGLCSILAGPLVGRLIDSAGKYPVFFGGTVLGMIMVTIYCHLGHTPLWLVIVVNVLLFVAISARMIATSSLISAVPELKDRGAFMAINSSLQQFAGGTAAALAGLIVVQTDSGRIDHYGLLGAVVVVAMLITLWLMYAVHLAVMAKSRRAAAGKEPKREWGNVVPGQPAGGVSVRD